MAVSRRLRFEVLRRDNHACRYCGAAAPEAKLTVDHVIPVSLGGPDDATNLVTACVDCNAGKGSSAPDAALVAQVSEDALRWAAAIRLAARTLTEEDDEIDRKIEFVTDHWTYYDDRVCMIPDDYQFTLRAFFRSHLDHNDAVRFIDAAMHKHGLPDAKRWAYFCGCCRRRIQQIHDLARSQVGAV